MCEVKPGPRCATDTRGSASTAAQQYEEAHPDGPPVDPITAARESNRPSADPTHHSRVTAGTALAFDQALGSAQSNVREARRALRTYSRHSTHGTVLGQTMRDVEQRAGELRGLAHSAGPAGVSNEAFFTAMARGPASKAPDRQELPALQDPGEKQPDLNSEQRHLSMLIANEVRTLDSNLAMAEARLRETRKGVRDWSYTVGEGSVLGQNGQDVEAASVRLATLVEVAPVLGLDERGVRHAYHTGLSR